MRSVQIIKTLVALSLLAGFAAHASADEMPEALTGVWQVTATPDEQTRYDGGKVFQDALMFEAGEMLAENFALYGFQEAPCTTSGDQTISFTCTMNSRARGSATWTGTCIGGQVSGTLVWTKADGVVWRYTFTGTR